MTSDKLAKVLVDALQDLSKKLLKAYEDGHRPSSVDINDLSETLLGLADSITEYA